MEHNLIVTSTVLVKRAVLLQVGGFDARFRGPEDYDLWMRLAARGSLGFIDHPMAYYRQASDSLSMKSRQFLNQVLGVIDKAFGFEGVFKGRSGRRRACSYQYLCAAWGAAEAHDRGSAWKWILTALWLWPFRYQYAPVPRWGRLKLAWRILRGRGRNIFLS